MTMLLHTEKVSAKALNGTLKRALNAAIHTVFTPPTDADGQWLNRPVGLDGTRPRK